jgi:hypothetical protein
MPDERELAVCKTLAKKAYSSKQLQKLPRSKTLSPDASRA